MKTAKKIFRRFIVNIGDSRTSSIEKLTLGIQCVYWLKQKEFSFFQFLEKLFAEFSPPKIPSLIFLEQIEKIWVKPQVSFFGNLQRQILLTTKRSQV